MDKNSPNSNDRTNPQTKQGNSFGFPSKRGNGGALINKAPSSRTTGVKNK